MKVIVPEAVEKSLFEIAIYIAQDNLAAAEKVAAALEALCLALADHPERGAVVASIRGKPIRRVIEGRYLIFYTVTDDAVHIRKIVHGARSPRQLLKNLDLS